MTVDEMIDDIIRREGGYVNHPKDRGGPTKYGITLATLRSYRDDKRLTAKNVEELSEVEARNIYRSNYFFEPRLAKLPPALQPFLFDCAVNHGASRAVKFLQRACEAKEDGIIGPATLAQVNKYTPEGLLRAMIDIRRNFYLNIVRNDPEQKDFLKGWLNRLAEFELEEETEPVSSVDVTRLRAMYGPGGTRHAAIEALLDKLDAADERIAELEAALGGLTEHYVRMINSGDCGNWDPEEEEVIQAARKALK